ncbi:MAG: hypothetical protein ACOX1P_24525, partial [Thermoguttaceae bacterium]
MFTAPLLIALAAPAFTQESTREDFKEYCRLLQGRWVGDVTWVADWPGFGKKGEKVTAYCETKIVEDGNVMIQRFFGGPGSGTGLYAYDATVKQIRLMWADSAGAMSQGIVFKKEGKWCEKASGSLADGTKTQGVSILTITGNGKTFTWTGTGSVGG